MCSTKNDYTEPSLSDNTFSARLLPPLQVAEGLPYVSHGFAAVSRGQKSPLRLDVTAVYLYFSGTPRATSLVVKLLFFVGLSRVLNVTHNVASHERLSIHKYMSGRGTWLPLTKTHVTYVVHHGYRRSLWTTVYDLTPTMNYTGDLGRPLSDGPCFRTRDKMCYHEMHFM